MELTKEQQRAIASARDALKAVKTGHMCLEEPAVQVGYLVRSLEIVTEAFPEGGEQA